MTLFLIIMGWAAAVGAAVYAVADRVQRGSWWWER